MVLDETKYSELCANFEREYKRIEPYQSRRPLTKNEDKRKEYKECIVKTYNEIINFFSPQVPSLSEQEKQDVANKITTHLKKLRECFEILHLEYQFGDNLLKTIDINNINENLPSASNSNSQKNGKSTKQTTNNTKVDNRSESSEGSLSHANSSDSIDSIPEMADKPQTKVQFLATANRTITCKFDGDPLALDSFIDAIELLKTVCEEQNQDTMVKYIMTKLEGKAREAILEIPENADDIIEQLRETIKTESAKVIEGRMLALRTDKSNLTKFAERAEELAEQLRRSLANEGFSRKKAKELSIEKTVELCRKNTRNETVNAILASTKFSEPKEVIAKMIIEINNLKTFRNQSQYAHKNGNHKNGNGNTANKFHKNNSKNYNSNSHGNSNNGRNYGNGNKSNYSGPSHKNGQGNSRTFTNSNYKRSNEQPVRFVQGNEIHPGNGGQASENQQ